MTVIEEILDYQIKHDLYFNEHEHVEGIAKRAVDKGYDSLTDKQKNVLIPHLTKYCSGHTNPGGFHNECDYELSGEELLNAYLQCDDNDSLKCPSCLDEDSYEQHIWNKYYVD